MTIDQTLALAAVIFLIPLIFSITWVAIFTCANLIRKKPQHQQNMKREIDNLIAATKGKFFSITFEKKDGTVRIINGKDKYKRLLKGGENMVEHAGYISAVNRNKETWFSFQPDSVVTFKCGAIEKKFLV